MYLQQEENTEVHIRRENYFIATRSNLLSSMNCHTFTC